MCVRPLRWIAYLLGPAIFFSSFISSSCTNGAPEQPVATTQTESSVNNSAPSPSLKSIRDVDFANFTYDWFPQKLESAKLYNQITLTKGNFTNEDIVPEDVTPVVVQLGHVSYSDFNGDGLEDALVFLSGSVPMNSFLGALLIYQARSDASPVLVWKHETGDRGNGGLRGVRVENRSLVIDEYSPEVNPVQSLCCPSKYKRSYYRWQGDQFVLTKWEVLNNEYSNAYVVGFQ